MRDSNLKEKIKDLAKASGSNKLDKHALGFHYDQKASGTGISGFRSVFPGSRQSYISLVEEAELQGTTSMISGDIECHHLHWEFNCPKYWDDLEKTSFDDVRHCNTCDRRVYTAYTRKQLNKLVDEGQCVRVITNSDPIPLMGVLHVPDDFVDTNEKPKLYSDPDAMLLINEIASQLLQVEMIKNKASKYLRTRKPLELISKLNSDIERIEARLPTLLKRLAQQIIVGLRTMETLLPKDYDLTQLDAKQHEKIALVSNVLAITS